MLLLVCSCDRSSSLAVGSATLPDPTPLAPSEPASAPAPPPVAPASAYDLSADLALRTRIARARFGERTRVHVEGDAFLLIDADHGPGFDVGRSQVHRAVHALLSGPFEGPPDRAVTVYIFSTHPAYVAFSKERFGVDPEPHNPGDRPLYGYYRRTPREMLMDGTTGWGTLIHEIAHPFVQRWFAPSENLPDGAPSWIDEGIASVFEQPIYDPRDGSIHGESDWRYDQLRAALDSRDLGSEVRLESLFAMSDDEFVGRDATTEGLHYGMARFVCQWLDSRGQLWPFFHDWRRAAAAGDDPTGLTSFTRTVGWTPADANAAWVDYVRRHPPPGWTGARAHP